MLGHAFETSRNLAAFSVLTLPILKTKLDFFRNRLSKDKPKINRPALRGGSERVLKCY